MATSTLLRVGSLFSGIGGFDLGFERAGMRVVWQVEREPYCRRVLRKHWPDVPCYDDVRYLPHDIEQVDVLCGGFPCQDVSEAGRKKGLRDGAKSSAWVYFARLIGKLRPSYVVVENVSALTRRGLDIVLADLAALGYDAEWECLPASAFGAHHERDRLWLVAYPHRLGEGSLEAGVSQPDTNGQGVRDSDPDGEQLQRGADKGLRSASDRLHPPTVTDTSSIGRGAGTEGQGVGGTSLGERQPADGGGILAYADALRCARQRVVFGQARWSELEGSRSELGITWAVEPDVGRVAYGIPSRVDRMHALGNALVPQVAEYIGRAIVRHHAGLSLHC
jgi:DNA (cytosine-5)-methyltransferase 1